MHPILAAALAELEQREATCRANHKDYPWCDYSGEADGIRIARHVIARAIELADRTEVAETLWGAMPVGVANAEGVMP